MPTCPSCAAMIEQGASACWCCGVGLGVQGQMIGASTASAAPTVAAGDIGSGPRPGSVSDRLGSVSDRIGREIIGQYVILDKIGEGGMGEVFLADQSAIGRQVAIKIVLPPTRGRDDDEHVARFRNEAKAAASLESPHIVQIFNWGELEDGALFMAMEYLAGRTLAQFLADEGPLGAELSVAIATQICTALAEAHGAGIVHRDLKPSNIMLIERSEQPHFVKVLDFGVAKLEGSDITRSGAMFGTPQYMSPEQLRGEGLDGRSDLYSLGVMLYELLTGELPFVSPTVVGFITAHLYHPPPPLPVTVPRALAEVVMMLLAKHASERPPDALAVIVELRAALGGRSPAARRRARRRGLRRFVGRSAALVGVLALSYGGWRAWDWQVQTQAELARERAHGAQLEEQVRQSEAVIQQVREEARAAALELRQTSEEVREQREQVQRSRAVARRTPSLDPETRAMLGHGRAQLEAELRRTFEQRRVPPSEVESVWRDYAARAAAVEAGALDEAELREDLIASVAMYRRSFELMRPGDHVELERLEHEFLTMATKAGLDQTQRQAMLDATYEEYDRDPSVAASDRAFGKRLAVAALIREHRGEREGAGEGPGAGAGVGEPVELPPLTDQEPLDPGLDADLGMATGTEAGAGTGSGALPSADDEDRKPPPKTPLPSLEGM